MEKQLKRIIGKVSMDIRKKSWWFHSPDLYDSYDTYAKMKRYRKEWKGVERINIYDNERNDTKC